jgi:cobalt-precorrin 5A hydrolase
MLPPAILTLTPRGLDLAQRLAGHLGRGQVFSLESNARPALQELFRSGRPLICVMALGIVVRILGPLTADKQHDPAVVVVDEAGRFAISVLGGHAQGGNALAEEVARALGATPVITTASDVLGLPAVDLIGQRWGWKIEGREHLTAVAAAVVRSEAVAVFQDAGRRDWWQEFGDWPASFRLLDELPGGNWPAALVISDRRHPPVSCPSVSYRPPSLVAGIGCKRGVPCAEIEELFQAVCTAHGLAPLSLGVVATVDLKANEPGLRDFAALYAVGLRSFRRDELAAVGPLPTPSEQVRAKIGIAGVAEPAALLAAEAQRLLVPKQRGPRVTLALARREA